ncbi:hypothetical protein L1987_46354 [Smallanthus sonchifolius]|uniref:Uncharacterized protein n=1 Tax=Smallanthus sonchifolius TaxID=185202 RepID=A0ACB9G0I0_9ASTR|nr:hypothetical protein L1987_46354 [Smallanthus sonchifolius]
MAKILQRGFRVALSRWDRGSPLGRRWFTSDALVEVKPGEVGIISGIPQEQLRRRVCPFHQSFYKHRSFIIRVLIYSPARTASQQGYGKVGKCKINFLSMQKCSMAGVRKQSGRIHYPYANVGDAGLSFNSEEAAKAFAEKHGWEYEVCSCS